MATSMVSTATAAAYLEGDVPKLGVSRPILALIILVALCLVGFFQVKESSIVTLTFTMIHVSGFRSAFRRVLLTHLRPSFFQ